MSTKTLMNSTPVAGIFLLLLLLLCRHVTGTCDLDAFCRVKTNDATSYCKTWNSPPVCQGSDVVCESSQCGPPSPPPPPSQPSPPTEVKCGDTLCRSPEGSPCVEVCKDVFLDQDCGPPAPAPPSSPPSSPGKLKWLAFTYTDVKNKVDFFDQISAEGYDGVFVYGGDVEFYCRGQPMAPSGGGASGEDVACIFAGPQQNAFVYYDDFSRATAAKYKKAGMDVWITFDGRVGQFVPDFSKLTAAETREFARAVANTVCYDTNVAGLSWDVEPFNNNQVEFFAQLDQRLAQCGKRWSIFAFGAAFDESMWTKGLGQTGFLLESTYDLDGGRPCDCVDPEVYRERLVQSLDSTLKEAKKHGRQVMPLFSGGGSTQIYSNITTAKCLFGDGTVYVRDCPHTMNEYAAAAVAAVRQVGNASDLFPLGAGIYPYTTTDNGGFAPSVPPAKTVKTFMGLD